MTLHGLDAHTAIHLARCLDSVCHLIQALSSSNLESRPSHGQAEIEERIFVSVGTVLVKSLPAVL